MAPKLRRCVKCDLHGVTEEYKRSHKTVCLHRRCQCKGCQQHDQLLAILSRERIIRRERSEERRGEDLLSRDIMKRVKEEMESIWVGIQPSNQAAGREEIIVLDSDSDVDICKETPEREASAEDVHQRRVGS